VAKSLPNSAAVFVNWLPVICIPSPESPQKRITAFSMVSRLRASGSVVVKDILFPYLGSGFEFAA
jgi:hypothetical protein